MKKMNISNRIVSRIREIARLGGAKSVFLDHRFYLMGIAMILVILYHLYCSLLPDKYLILLPFSIGFLGVDIFFFFSSLGLSFSYNKNGVVQFYYNRLVRILPLFLVWAVVHLLYTYYIQNVEFGVLDIFSCCTTLSYYGIGTVRSNWYLSGLIGFYVLFPLLFFFGKKMKVFSVYLFIVLVLIVQGIFEFEWFHKALICRFPIFLLGLYVWILLDSKKESWANDIIQTSIMMSFLAILIFLFTKGKYLFLVISLFSPVIMFVLALLRKSLLRIKIGQYIEQLFCFVGRHSLEFFVGNCWTMLLMNEIVQFTSLQKTILYLVSNLIFALVLIPFNKLILKMFNYRLA